MDSNQSHAAANEVEHLVQSVSDLQRRHAELDIMLARINRDLEHRYRDTIALKDKYHTMREDYMKACQDTENLRSSSATAKQEMHSLQMGCTQLAQSIQSMEETIQTLQSQQESGRRRILKSIGEAKESYAKLTASLQAQHKPPNPRSNTNHERRYNDKRILPQQRNRCDAVIGMDIEDCNT